MEPPPATFQVNGAALREDRMRQGLGIKETAEAAGISRSYLQRLETSARQRMRPALYVRLRTALNSTDERLLAPSEKPHETR
ncbi:helix-turn-helix domain-containing protein [Streptomyces sp. NPDC056670]|uniref:helix-turn-helix domain-containing protein n=1 Tax=Streptomyces sp. NPDC056670 TaxID=3345904 RepID=UPI0036B73513